MELLVSYSPEGPVLDFGQGPRRSAIGPAGIAIDSKGLVYVADQKVGAVFIFNLFP